MRMLELKALVRKRRLRGYSKLRKAELIELLSDNEHQAQRQQRSPPPPLRGTQCPIHGCLLGNQINLHRCLLGNQNVNRKPKSDNQS